jgi:hypothetical protein
MLRVSFRWFATRSFPSVGAYKPLLVGVALVLVLAGCGGGKGKAGPANMRTVSGKGYRFLAPMSWRVRRQAATVTVASGPVELIRVTTFPLARRYEPRLWKEAVPALDQAARELAAQLDGRVQGQATVVVAGRRARRYEIRYVRSGRRLVERTAFVLVGKREYQLLCRFEAGGDDSACRTLLNSFRPE